MPSIVIIWLLGVLVVVPILCALGQAARRFDEEADDGLRRLMLRDLARRRRDRRGPDRRRAATAVAVDRRRDDRRVTERRHDPLTGAGTAVSDDSSPEPAIPADLPVLGRPAPVPVGRERGALRQPSRGPRILVPGR
jgi:hypothetical protein